MAATDTALQLIENSLGVFGLAAYTIELHAVSVDTDANGTGSTVVNHEQDFATGDVFPLVTGGADGDFYVSSAGASQTTVNVDGSTTTGGSVSVWLMVVGPDPSGARR
jgi:hypothetical protein